MGKYKINYIFGEEDIDNIFIKVLNKELTKYILTINKSHVLDNYKILKEGKN